MTYKVRAMAMVHVPATLEIEIEAASEDEALEKAQPELQRLDKQYRAALNEYNRSYGATKYPTQPFYWHVDDDDLDDAVDLDGTDIDFELA